MAWRCLSTVIIKDMKSVIAIIANNPLIHYDYNIFKPNSNGPANVSFPETSNFSNLTTNDTTIVSLTDENIIIRTLVPCVSPYPKDYLIKRDFEEDLDESFKPPRKCRPYCRCYACRMAYRPWKIWKS